MKLTYFNARGLGETIRYMFAIAEKEYEDKRIEFTFGTPNDFSTISRPEFDRLKETGDLVPSMNKLPLFTVDGVAFGQSKAIERFVAKRLGFMGMTDLEAAQIDAICEHVRDMKDAYKKAKSEDALLEWWPKFAELNKSLDKLIPDFLTCATRPTLAHITLYNFYYCFFDDMENATKSVEYCAKILCMCLIVKHNSNLIKYEKNRPETPF